MGQWPSRSLASWVDDHALLPQELYHAVPRQRPSSLGARQVPTTPAPSLTSPGTAPYHLLVHRLFMGSIRERDRWSLLHLSLSYPGALLDYLAVPEDPAAAVPEDPAATSTTSPRRRASARARSGKAALTSMMPAIM